MKLIKNMFFVDLGQSRKLLINTLNGRMDEIGHNVYDLIASWQKCEDITPNSPDEVVLFKYLEANGYLVKDSNEEKAKKEEILDVLRKNHSNNREKCKSISFVMTYDCNFACLYCFESGVERKKAVITPAMIDAALELAGDEVESVLLFGGEPFLPETKPVVEYIMSKLPNATYSAFTNGYYLESYVDLLSSVNVESIKVTLDGTEEVHDRRRPLLNGNPTFNEIINGISLCLNNNIPIAIKAVANKDTLDDCNHMCKYLQDKFKQSELLTFAIGPEMAMSENEKSDFLFDIFKSDIENLSLDTLDEFMAVNPAVRSIITSTPINPIYVHCIANENNFIFDPYGDLYTCLASVGREQLKVGTYYPTVSFKENSMYHRTIDSIPECQECAYSLLCGGGCPVALSDYSNMFRPGCKVTKKRMHTLIPLCYNAMKK